MDERLKSKIENWKRLQRKSGGNPGTVKLFNEMHEEIISQAEKMEELERHCQVLANSWKNEVEQKGCYQSTIKKAIAHFNQDEYIDGMHVLRQAVFKE